jgi:sugar lactone lactonase YvrE
MTNPGSRLLFGMAVLGGLPPAAGPALFASVYAPPYYFTTFAGAPRSADGAGSAAHFDFPYGIAVDANGTIYVADTGNNTVRKITPAGVVTTLAGAARVPGSADGTGSVARFSELLGLAVDRAGNVFAVDAGNALIRVITPAGLATHFAGGASLYGVAVDNAGNIYFTDWQANIVEKRTPAGVVTTLAGLAGSQGAADGMGSAARFNYPAGVAVDGAGNVYIADYTNDTIRKITPAGAVTTLAGLAGVSDATDGPGTAARFFYPSGVAVDGAGNVFVSDRGNYTIRKIDPSGMVTTLAGLAGSRGSTDGMGSAARFDNPEGVAVDGAGNIYVLDTDNCTVRKLSPAGLVTTLAGGAESRGSADGLGGSARFARPVDAVVDSAGNLYVADEDSCTIREINPAGVVTTLAGLAGNPGSADGAGTAARFVNPTGVAVDGGGNVYVADLGNGTIRKINPAAVVTTFAGSAGLTGSTDGTGSAARFDSPRDVAVDSAGNVYVADDNHTVRKITPAAVVTTLAGSPGLAGSTDGPGGAARFHFPSAVTVDSAGNVYVADTGNNTIRKITPAAVVTTLAGSAGLAGSTDGTGSAARFDFPYGITADSAGNVYVADLENRVIRKISPAGVVTTLGGLIASPGSGDGVGAVARFFAPNGVAVDGAGALYVVDLVENTIRKGLPASAASDITGDGQSEILWSNAVNGDRYFWQMNGASYGATVFLATVGPQWTVTTGDFNADGQNDLLWSNTVTGDRYIWMMNQTGFASTVLLATIAPEWIVTTGDFNSDGQADLLWSNTITGDRYVWLMDGITVSASVFLGNVDPRWTVTTGDFDFHGRADLMWSDTVTGDRYIWLMNGTTFSSGEFIGTVDPEWTVTAGDFDADGQTDLLWSNTRNGDHYLWFMNGTVVRAFGFVGTVDPVWSISN